MTTTFAEQLDILIRAHYTIVYLVTWEEHRAKQIILSVAQNQKKTAYEWSITEGLKDMGKLSSTLPDKTVTRDPLAALNHVLQETKPAIYMFKDLHLFVKQPHMIRQMRDLASALRNTHKTVVIVAPVFDLPVELEKSVTVLDLPLPSFDDLKILLDTIVADVRRNSRLRVELNDEEHAKLAKAALGLTMEEAENAFAVAVVRDGVLNAEDIDAVITEKKQIIRKSGLLEYFDTPEGMDSVGGLGLLKEWLQKRGDAFTEEARRYGLPQPKGALLLGVQGCGKSLVAKSVAGLWQLPLLRLDMSLIFSGLIGSSEANMRKAITVAESMAPVVLWIDEIEKAFSGIESSGISDGGTTARVVGTFLTWIQEKTSPVFVVATANSVSELPPELLRKGRFDEIFFVDLPMSEERARIFAIHIAKRGREPDSFQLERLARETEGFSGAEIEQAVVAGLHDSFAQRRELATEDISACIGRTVPLSVTMREDVLLLREWARDRARQASSTSPGERVRV